ncbi:MAG: hypothetical protein K6E54_00760 [Bacteroidaceae bacterium]|nr:hypothetical protein [Bacteroidaceae bacterium]
MKKILPILGSLMMMLSVFFFTSCESTDTSRSVILSGQWRGNFGMYYSYTTSTGRQYIFNSYDTYIVFYPEYDYATYGSGKQVDYYDEGPYDREYHFFYWEMKNGRLYLDYPYDRNLNTVICEYHLNNRRFYGYFENASEPFTLYKLSDYYDWNVYSGNYGYYSSGNWSYAKSRGIGSDSTNVDDFANGEITGHGNRFAEKIEAAK